LSEKLKKQAQRIEKPWGYELIWAHTDRYVGKILFVREGQALSLQYHQKKEETLFIESGTCLIETGPEESTLTPTEYSSCDIFHIPPGTLHRVTALSDTKIFEVSTPELSDVIRLKDRYGRN